jgi:predicted esterase
MAGCISATISERSFFFEDPPATRTHGRAPVGAETITIPAACGRVEVWTFEGSGDATVVYFGGNVFRLRSLAERARRETPAEADLVVFDYPGRGLTDGPPTPECTIEAGVAVGRWASSRSIGPVIYHGFSFGGFVAAHSAGRIGKDQAPDAVILESTAVDAKSWIAGLDLPITVSRINLPPSLQTFNNVEALSVFEGPIWVVAGQEDRSVPLSQAEALRDQLQSAGRDVTLDVFPGGHGAALVSDQARAAYAKRLGAP